MKTEIIKLIDLRTACIKALKSAGCDDANADAVSGTVCAAERDHCHSHGILRMPGYLKSISAGKANPTARPTWSKTAPGQPAGVWHWAQSWPNWPSCRSSWAWQATQACGVPA